VEPLVIFDGMQSPDKLATKIKRLQKQAEGAHIVQELFARSSLSMADFQSRISKDLALLPFFTVQALLQTLQEENVTFYRAAGEADPLLARYCRDGFCMGVVSNDTDFMVLDLGSAGAGWIPFQYLHVSPKVSVEPGSDNVKDKYTTHVRCKMVKRDALAAVLRLPSELMPVVASLCGNDLVDSRMLNKRLEHYAEKTGKRRSGKRNFHPLQLAAHVVRDHVLLCPSNTGDDSVRLYSIFPSYSPSFLHTALPSYSPSFM
jgi:hypothetical protein